jgi:branched-chain amino acid transport system permease protein
MSPFDDAMADILQVAANGIIAGSLVALLAVSYSLVYGVLRFINFAFGEVLMLGAYSFYVLRVSLEVPTVVAAVTSAIVVGSVGALLQAWTYRPFYRRSRLASLVAALGLSLGLQNAALMVFDGSPLSLPNSSDNIVRLGVIGITKPQIAVLTAALALLLVTDRIVSRSIGGLRVRALADNLAMAEVLGVAVDRTVISVFFFGSVLAATSGVFLSLEHILKPTMGVSPGIQAFAACVVGGIGSVRGAAAAAFGIAILSNFLMFAVPGIPADTTSYAVLLLALCVLPQGLSEFADRLTGNGRLRPGAIALSHPPAGQDRRA